MKITGHEHRAEWSSKARAAAKWARENGDEAAASAIEQEIGKLADGVFVVTIMGKAKRGKSTMINALLGRRDDVIAPIDKLPASSAISRFNWSPEEKATVTFRSGKTDSIPYERIRDYVTEEGNPENIKEVELVDICGPFPGAEPDLVLVDTPGAGSLHEHHDALLHAVIPQSDAVIFLVTSRMPLDQDEIELLERVKERDIRRIFFAINKVDEINLGDLQDALRHNRDRLQRIGIHIEKIYEISAKLALGGDVSGSGLPVLLNDLSDLFQKEKAEVLVERFRCRVRDLLQPLVDAKSLEAALAGKEKDEIAAEAEELNSAKAELLRAQPRVENDFNIEWASAVDDFERVLKSAYERVQGDLQDRIETTAMPALGALAKDLATILARTIERVLNPHSERLEQALREAVKKLEMAYPSLEIVDADKTHIRLKEDHAPLVKSGLLITASLTVPILPGAILSAAIPYVGWLLGAGATTMLLPLGFPLFGLAALTLPFAYRNSKLKLKDDMLDACQKQTKIVFDRLRYERVPDLRKVGEQLRRQFEARSQRQVEAFERALDHAKEVKHSPEQLKLQVQAASQGRQLLLEYTEES